MEKQHAEKCGTKVHKYDGDMRNIFPDERRECNCDGYHTFDELYEHRITLFIALCRQKQLVRATFIKEGVYMNGDSEIWKSRSHSDGTMFEGMFIMGIGTEKGNQITYHLPMTAWSFTDFVPQRKRAPKFDGHSSDDVIARLRQI